MSRTFNIAPRSQALSAYSTSEPSSNLYWPSSVQFIDDDAAQYSPAETADTAVVAAKPGGEPAAEHICSSEAELSLPSRQDLKAPGFMHRQNYSQLDKAEIRLLTLHQGDYEEDLLCELQNVDLSSRPDSEYEALSYTWADNHGDKTESQDIYIVGWPDVLKITVNCANALRRLRYPNRSRTLWVDSICINQSNNEERSHQVTKMSQIFGAAVRVLIYLGENPKDSNPRVSTSWVYEKYFDTIDLEADFTTLPYFSRTWVIQEVANARDAWCFYGTRKSHLEDFLQLNAQNRRQLNESHPWLFLVTQKRHRDVDDLLDLLLATLSCFASDERDKVFALLGLLTGAEQAGLVADYGLSLTQVFIGVTAFTMQRDFCRTMSLVRPSFKLQLPSWVVNWSSVNGHLEYCMANWPERQSGQPHRNSIQSRVCRDGTLVIKAIPILNLNDPDCFFCRRTIEGPPGVLPGIHYEPNYRQAPRNYPKWAHASDKLFRVLDTDYSVVLRPLRGTTKHDFVAICKRQVADGMAHVLNVLDRIVILVMSAWNEILANKDHQTWFQPHIWEDIKEVCVIIESFHPRSMACDPEKTESVELVGKTEEESDSQRSQDAEAHTDNCQGSHNMEAPALSEMVACLRRKIQSARTGKPATTDGGIDGGVPLSTTICPSSSELASPPVIETIKGRLSTLVQGCWDWRKVASAEDRNCYEDDLCQELGFSTRRVSLYWHPEYVRESDVEPIAERLRKRLGKSIKDRKIGEIPSQKFLKYLISQTLSVKTSVFDNMLRREYRNRTKKDARLVPKEELYESRKLPPWLNWMKMSLNFDQSQTLWWKNGKSHEKPWATSFVDMWSQLGLHDTQSERKEVSIGREDGKEVIPEASSPSSQNATPAVGESSCENGFEHDAWKMLLELVDETRSHLLPLEEFFISRANVKTSAGGIDEGSWDDVYIV